MATATFAQALFGGRAAVTPLRLAARRPRPCAGVGRWKRWHRQLLPPFCPAVGLVRPAASQQVPRWGWYVQLPRRGPGEAPRPLPRHVPRGPLWPRPTAAPPAGGGGWHPRSTRKSPGGSEERVVPAVPGRREAYHRVRWRTLPPLRPGFRPRRAAGAGGGAAAGLSAPPGRAAAGPRRGGARPALRADGTTAEGPTLGPAPGL